MDSPPPQGRAQNYNKAGLRRHPLDRLPSSGAQIKSQKIGEGGYVNSLPLVNLTLKLKQALIRQHCSLTLGQAIPGGVYPSCNDPAWMKSPIKFKSHFSTGLMIALTYQVS